MKHGNYDVVLASWKAKLIITVNQKRDFILPLKTTNPPLILATHLLFLLIETYFYFDKNIIIFKRIITKDKTFIAMTFFLIHN